MLFLYYTLFNMKIEGGNAMYRIPIEVLEEIIGKKLGRDYKDFGTSVPLSALPPDIRDRYKHTGGMDRAVL